MAFTLIQHRLCPRSRAIRLALAELGQDAKLIDEQPLAWTDSLLAKNPAGEFPILETDDGAIICGCYAIAEFLSERGSRMTSASTRRAASLFPGGSEERAEVRRLVDWFQNKFDREVSREILVEKVFQRLDRNNRIPPNADILRIARTNLRYHLSYLTFLADARRWLGGDELSFADLMAASQLSVIDFVGEVDWDSVPSVKEWYQRLKSRPSFRQLLSDHVVGTAPPAHYVELDF